MRYLQKQELGARPITALILTDKEWKSIKNPIIDAQRNEEQAEKYILQREEKKEKSKLITAHWPNTIASMQLQREKLILGKAQRANEQKLEEYNAIIEGKKKEKDEMIERAKRMIYERHESSRIINSGLVLSNVLHERSKQVELEKAKRQQLVERAMEERSLRRYMAEAYSKEIHEEKVKHEASMQNYKRMLDTQMVDVLHQREVQRKQKAADREDLEETQTELKLLAEKEIQESREKKEKLKQEQELWAKIDAQYKDQRRKKEEEADIMNSIYRTVQEKISKQRAEMEKKLKQEVIERRAKAEESRNLQLDDKTNEEELLQIALQEKEEALMKELEARAQKKEKLRQELKSYEKEAAILAEEDAKRRFEIQRFEMVQRLAIDQGDKKWRAARNEEKRNEQKELREALIEQWTEQEKRKIDSKWDDVTAYEREKDAEAKALLHYCSEIEKAALDSGRPMNPVLAAIERVKKSAGLSDKKKKVAFLQSRVPISSIKAYEKKQEFLLN